MEPSSPATGAQLGNLITLDGQLYHLYPVMQVQPAKKEDPGSERTGGNIVTLLLAVLASLLFLPVLFRSPSTVDSRTYSSQGTLSSPPLSNQLNTPLPGAVTPVVTSNSFSSSISVPASNGNYVVVTSGGFPVNGRSGPGMDFPAQSIYLNGTRLEVTGRRVDSWVELTNGEWVWANLVSASP